MNNIRFNLEELKIEIGLSAYINYKKENINNKILTKKNQFRMGVCIEHIPTGIKVYSNKHDSQIKNRDECIKNLDLILSNGHIYKE